jgi:hypothetical protein
MKKFILTVIIAFMMIFSANAQVATENAKLFDNTYVGVEVGATTPLNFNSMFPVNPVAGIKFGKELTPVFGLELEGLAMFGDNVYRWGVNGSIPAEGKMNVHQNGSVNTFVKATNVGLNGTINWSNLLFGYRGAPRVFEVKTNTGFGWLHYYGDFTPNFPVGGYIVAGKRNVLSAKTAIDFAFNLGKLKAHTITLSPGVYWGLNEIGNVKFNKNYAQFGVMLGYTYHFKTSNGTHYFKTYDVGAMMSEIDRLNDELAKKPTEVRVEVPVEVPVPGPIVGFNETYVFFAKNSAELSGEAKTVLDNLEGTYDVVGSASIEGTKEYNLDLSERRAATVAKYLIDNNPKVTVNSISGIGAVDATTGRVVVLTLK